MVREGRVFINPAGRPAYGGNYRVKACAVGAQVRSASSGTTINVHAGHGFSVGDRFIVGTDTERFRAVTAVSSGQLEVNEAVSVANHELLINIGSDTGTTGGPNFDATAVQIFLDMAYQDAPADATVTADSVGRYRYWHKGVPRWELVLALGTPVAVYMDTGQQADEDLVSYQVRYAHLFATGGTGTAADPWVTAGSNPVQAAVDDLPTRGGVIHMTAGHYDLGNAAVAVNIPILTSGLDYDHQYVFRGDGRDMTFLRYSGTGSAFKYAQVAVGPLPETGSWQSNQLVFEDFGILQTGTLFTGTAFFMSYVTESLFHRLNIGTPRVFGGPSVGEPGYGFEYGIRLEGLAAGQNVVDFNKIDNCIIRGNTIGVFAQNQADALVVTRCFFVPDISNTSTCQGLRVHNSNGYLIQGNTFNYYGRGSVPASSRAVLLSGYAVGANVIGNYFENNPISVYVSVDSIYQGCTGVTISGNAISFNQSPGSQVGIKVGQSGSFHADGVVISANSFYLLSATNVGIVIGSEVRSYSVISNGYNNTGGTNRVIADGSKGVVQEMFDSTNFKQVLHFKTKEDDASPGQITLENDSTGNYPAPRIKLIPGSGGSGAGAGVLLGCSPTGDFQVQDDLGVVQFSVTQTGGVTSLGNITSGGHLQGLLATQAFTGNDTIAHGGRTVVDITNTSGANTLVVAAPSSVDGKILILRVKAITAGSFVIADSGNVSLSAAWDSAVGATVGSTLTLIASGVVWYEVARSKNT